jgi:hypothetical protein
MGIEHLGDIELEPEPEAVILLAELVNAVECLKKLDN